MSSGLTYTLANGVKIPGKLIHSYRNFIVHKLT